MLLAGLALGALRRRRHRACWCFSPTTGNCATLRSGCSARSPARPGPRISAIAPFLAFAPHFGRLCRAAGSICLCSARPKRFTWASRCERLKRVPDRPDRGRGGRGGIGFRRDRLCRDHGAASAAAVVGPGHRLLLAGLGLLRRHPSADGRYIRADARRTRGTADRHRHRGDRRAIFSVSAAEAAFAAGFMTPVLDAASITVRAGTKTLLEDVSLSFRSRADRRAGRSQRRGQVHAAERPCRRTQAAIRQGKPAGKRPGVIFAAYARTPSRRAVATDQYRVSVYGCRCRAHGRRAKARCRTTRLLVEAALAEVDLTALADRAIPTLSGGEQQRAHFARVWCSLRAGQDRDGAGILLLDEPTAGLDLRHQLAMLDSDQAPRPGAGRSSSPSCTI